MAWMIDVDALKERIRQEPTDGMYTEEILRAIEDQPAVEVTGWIPVMERLPEVGKRVIVARKGKEPEQGIYLGVNGWWKVYGTNTKAVTHWMPMPEPPKEVR